MSKLLLFVSLISITSCSTVQKSLIEKRYNNGKLILHKEYKYKKEGSIDFSDNKQFHIKFLNLGF